MIDYIIVSSITSSIREKSEHSVTDSVLCIAYVVLTVAAVVTAASLRSMKRGDTSAITLATLSPCIYFTLLPFNVLSSA